MSLKAIVALYIYLLLIPVNTSLISLLSHIKLDYQIVDDEIALMQLRELLLISYDVEVNDDNMNFIYQQKDFSLEHINDKLILKPGTQIILANVSDMHFIKDGSSINIKYMKDNVEYERCLTYQNRLYLELFSGDDVDNLDTDQDM